jgi:flagellar biosynthetic protein FliR
MVDDLTNLILPYLLIFCRIGAFVGVMPVFSSPAAPMIVRTGLAFVLTAFFSVVCPPAVPHHGVPMVTAGVWMGQEAIYGLALGLAARFIFVSVQQGAFIIAQQMGFTDAEVIDPISEEETQTIVTFFEMVFTLFFLTVNGHLLMLALMRRGFDIFPTGSSVNLAALTSGLVTAGSAMLLFAMKLAAPLLAAFLIVAVVLAILARIMPEMDIFMESFPLRIGAGLFMAAAIVPTLDNFTQELSAWMRRYLIS